MDGGGFFKAHAEKLCLVFALIVRYQYYNSLSASTLYTWCLPMLLPFHLNCIARNDRLKENVFV